MPSDGLIVIAPIRPGSEEALRETLNRVGNDIRGTRRSVGAGQANLEFCRSRRLHFARMTLFDDPDRGVGRQRLLLATDYDGSWEAHIEELFDLTRGSEAIWGCCEGYDGPASFPSFIREHTVDPGAYYIAFRGRTLTEIQRAVALREDVRTALAGAEAEAGRVYRQWSRWRSLIRVGRALWRGAVWLPSLLLRFASASVDLVGLMRLYGVREVIRSANRINATLDRIAWVRVLNRVFANRPTPPPHRYSEAASGEPPTPIPAGYPPEDAVLQNQLTLVTDVRPNEVSSLRAVLGLIDLYGRRLSSPGSLVGISTIHTVRWTLLDGGKRLLMVSNYDGSWENYIDEFAEMILSGLDALWLSAPDYPRAGAQDVAALKVFLRRHQVPANAFYSGYPSASVLNLRHDLEFDRWFGGNWRRRRRREGSPDNLP